MCCCFNIFFKLLEELGTGIIQQYRADANSPVSDSPVPVSQVGLERFLQILDVACKCSKSFTSLVLS